MAPLVTSTPIYMPSETVISTNGAGQARVIIDPEYPDLTISDVVDYVEEEEAQAMARRPDETIIIHGGYLANLWRMNDGWWLYDTPEIEGNRAQEETRDEAIKAAIEGIDMIRRAIEREKEEQAVI